MPLHTLPLKKKKKWAGSQVHKSYIWDKKSMLTSRVVPFFTHSNDPKRWVTNLTFQKLSYQHFLDISLDFNYFVKISCLKSHFYWISLKSFKIEFLMRIFNLITWIYHIIFTYLWSLELGFFSLFHQCKWLSLKWFSPLYIRALVFSLR